jgi:hypothetical protein
MMDEQDEKLYHLLVSVRQSPQGSLEWQRSLGRLLVLIQQLPEFNRYTRTNCPHHCLDALNRTWEWFSREVHNFQPRPNSSIRTDLVKWVNGYLYWRLKDLAQIKERELSLDKPIYDADAANPMSLLDLLSDEGSLKGASTPALDGLDIYLEKLEQESRQVLANKIEEYILQDPDERLRKCYPRKYPNCNAQLLGQRRCLQDQPDSLAEIAREFDVHYQTLVSHWKLKVVPLLQEVATELDCQSHH